MITDPAGRNAGRRRLPALTFVTARGVALMAVTAAVGLTAFPLLHPAWVMVR